MPHYRERDVSLYFMLNYLGGLEMETLIIFTIAGSTFSFKNVGDFNLGSDHISFSYSGQRTGRRNRATFYHISMVGYSWLGELEEESEEDV